MTLEEALNKTIGILTYHQVYFCKSKKAAAHLDEIIDALEKIDQEPKADNQVKPELNGVKTELGDCISRAETLRALDEKFLELQKAKQLPENKTAESKQLGVNWCINTVKELPSVTPQEPKADYKAFAEWVAKEIFSDEWELNKDAFAEIACRKLAKLGIVEESGDKWVLNESDEDDMTIQFKISKYLYKCLKKRIELNVASELDRLVDKGTVIGQAPSCSPDPIITIDGIRYIAEEPRLKTVHKDGEVVIGGFKEVQE